MNSTRTASRTVPSHQPLRSASGANQPPARPGVGPFFSLQQIAERHPGFTVRTLRYWIVNAASRHTWKNQQAVVIPGNGFDRVIVRKGRRIFIDEAALFAWLARDSAPEEMPEK